MGARACITLHTDDARQAMPLYKGTDSEGQMADEPTFYWVVFLLQFQLSSTWCPPDVLNFTCQNSRSCHPSHLEGTGMAGRGNCPVLESTNGSKALCKIRSSALLLLNLCVSWGLDLDWLYTWIASGNDRWFFVEYWGTTGPMKLTWLQTFQH